jgi:hypothetical protein
MNENIDKNHLLDIVVMLLSGNFLLFLELKIFYFIFYKIENILF